MKLIDTTDALGHVLCHDITQIIRGETKDARFRKGHIITAEDIPVLLSLGKEHLYVWEKDTNMLHENEAAEILYHICAGEYMDPTPVKEGKIEVIAQIDGLLTIDTERLRQVNSLGEMMIATRASHFPVQKGDHLAGTRIIPLVIEKEKMEQAKAIAGDRPLLELHPYIWKRAALITTGSEVYKGRIKDTFSPVIADKLSEYGAEVVEHTLLPDEHQQITEAIKKALSNGVDLVIVTGGMSVDPDDRTPLAIKNTGAKVVSYGAPVLPGAMFMLAYADGGIPIMGLPGCVMYAKRTIFDLILPRVLAGIEVSAADLAGLGHGGLCLNCDECTFPKCGFGKGV